MAETSTKIKLLTLEDLDNRTRATQDAKDMIAAMAADLGGDLSTAQQALVERVAISASMLRHMEAGWLSGAVGVDVGAYAAIGGLMLRAVSALGLKRVARDVLTLDAYLKGDKTTATPRQRVRGTRARSPEEKAAMDARAAFARTHKKQPPPMPTVLPPPRPIPTMLPPPPPPPPPPPRNN